MARAYKKKPVTVEAVQWTGENHAEMCEFIDPEVFEIIPREGLVIHTLEGDHHASPGDYIIKGVNGEFYPCGLRDRQGLLRRPGTAVPGPRRAAEPIPGRGRRG